MRQLIYILLFIASSSLQSLQLTAAQTMCVDSVYYVDNFYYTPLYFYYVRDHQGNNMLTVDSNGATENSHSYYAGGLPWSYIYITPTDTHSYNDKEFDHIHGLDWYDYGARRYDPAFCQFTQIDPLAEKYYHLNPYTYCAGNPVRYVDPDGKSFWSKIVKVGARVTKRIAKDGIKALGETATYTSSVIDITDDINTLIDNDASIEDRVWAGVSLASEALPVSLSDVKDVGKALKHGGVKEFKDIERVSTTNPMSINQLQREVERGRAPKNIKRFDKKKDNPKQQDHVHFKNPNSALNRDGTWKDGTPFLIDKDTKEFLLQNGWTID